MMIRAENAGNKECQHVTCGQHRAARFGVVIVDTYDLQHVDVHAEGHRTGEDY